MTITRVVEGNTIEIEDLNQLIDLLEGGNSQTLAFKFVSKTGENFIVKLADAAGARKFSIQDSAGVEVASINSNGEASFAQITSTGATLLPSSTTPADTTEASIQWDSNDDRIAVGTGSAVAQFLPGIGMGYLVGASTTEATSTSTTDDTILRTVTLTESVSATAPLLVMFNYRKSTGHASAVYFGVKLNTTIMLNGTSSTPQAASCSANNQAESGIAMVFFGPRRAAYTSVWGRSSTFVTASGASNGDSALEYTATTNPAPTAAITEVTITGKCANALNTMAVQDVFVYKLMTSTS